MWTAEKERQQSQETSFCLEYALLSPTRDFSNTYLSRHRRTYSTPKYFTCSLFSQAEVFAELGEVINGSFPAQREKTTVFKSLGNLFFNSCDPKIKNKMY